MVLSTLVGVLCSLTSDIFTETVNTDTEYVEIGEETKRIHYDPKVIPILEDIKRSPLQENDSVILFSGRPGVGKTKLAMDFCYYLDRKFSLDQVVFSTEELIDVALKLEPGRAILFDEAREGTDSTQVLSEKNRRLGLFLDTVRSRCLFIVLIQPSFWNFAMSIATERSDMLVHVFKQKNVSYDRNDPVSLPFERGFYNVYNFERKRFAYIAGKKFHVFRKAIKPNIAAARFGNRWVLDKKEYQKRKDAAVARMNQEADDRKVREEMAKDTRVNVLRLKYLKSFKQNWPSVTIDTFAQLSGEQKKVLVLCMDAECRSMYGISLHTKV